MMRTVINQYEWAIAPTFDLAALASVTLPAVCAESDFFDDFVRRSIDMGLDDDGVATISICGTICEADPWACFFCDLTPPSAIRAVVERYASDVHCTALHFVINSPGGCTSGVPELVDCIAAVDKPKDVTVFGQCCSAAYWIASACGPITASRGAVIGCLGVYAAYYDTQRQAEQRGITVHLISTSDLKGAGEWGTALTEAQRDMFARFIKETGAMFLADIKRGRPDFNEALFNGDFWHADRALELGLIDDMSL